MLWPFTSPKPWYSLRLAITKALGTNLFLRTTVLIEALPTFHILWCRWCLRPNVNHYAYVLRDNRLPDNWNSIFVVSRCFCLKLSISHSLELDHGLNIHTRLGLIQISLVSFHEFFPRQVICGQWKMFPHHSQYFVKIVTNLFMGLPM